MQNPLSETLLAALFTVLTILVPSSAVATIEDRDESGERLERLEQRVNELAQRQEQFLRRLGQQMERPSTSDRRGPDQQAPFVPRTNKRGGMMGQPMAAFRPGPNAPAQPMPSPGVPTPGPQHPQAVKLLKGVSDTLGLLFLIGIICNILLAIWIYTDIRKRGEGSGIFIAVALVAGIPAAIIYALARIGDTKP